MISWQGTGTDDHAATAAYHRAIAAHERGRGNAALAAQHEAVAARYTRRAAATKRAAKACRARS